MDLSNIISISGMSGLSRVVGQIKNGIVAEDIQEGRRFPVHASDKVSALEDISIYSETEDVPLEEVFKMIHEKESGKEALSHKESGKKIKAYFKEAFPEHDEDRVYVSDIKKVLKWYNILHKAGLLEFEEEKTEEKADDKKEEVKEKKKAKPTGNKKTGKKAATPEKKSSGKKKATKSES